MSTNDHTTEPVAAPASPAKEAEIIRPTKITEEMIDIARVESPWHFAANLNAMLTFGYCPKCKLVPAGCEREGCGAPQHAKQPTREGETPTPICDSNIVRYSNVKPDDLPFEYIPLHVGRTLEQRAEAAERRAADAEAIVAQRAEINTHVRLFDLVRFQRSELHEAELITDEEYFWLCSEADMANSPQGGSPSPRRLESYDEVRAKLTAAESERDALRAEVVGMRDRLKIKLTDCQKAGGDYMAGFRDALCFILQEQAALAPASETTSEES